MIRKEEDPFRRSINWQMNFQKKRTKKWRKGKYQKRIQKIFLELKDKSPDWKTPPRAPKNEFNTQIKLYHCDFFFNNRVKKKMLKASVTYKISWIRMLSNSPKQHWEQEDDEAVSSLLGRKCNFQPRIQIINQVKV